MNIYHIHSKKDKREIVLGIHEERASSEEWALEKATRSILEDFRPMVDRIECERHNSEGFNIINYYENGESHKITLWAELYKVCEE